MTNFKTFVKVFVLFQLNCVYGWTPVSSQSSAFSLYQTFPNSVHSPSESVFDLAEKSNHADLGSCTVNKFAFEHEATVKYDVSVEKLEQFSLCTWARFTRHDGDHVLFTYAVHDEPREIQFWVANSNSSSFISLAVRGHSLYRLNYPLGLKKWHHVCTSWNGKTGEWQLWVKSERVGRGFYNRLVSHEIEAGGNAFSGGKSVNGPIATGYHFEAVLLQLYSVALSAGKAHRDHKHHHVHKFDHNGEIEATTTVAPPPTMNPMTNPNLANGQIPTRVKINFAGTQPETQPMTINTNFVRGQFHSGDRILQEQLLNVNANRQVFAQGVPANAPFAQGVPANAPRFPLTYSSNIRFKRQLGSYKISDNQVLLGLPEGLHSDSSLFDSDWYDGLAQFGDVQLKQKLTKRDNLEDEIKEHDREPAEGEVEAVRSYCNYCLIEPFQNALVIPWNTATNDKNVLKAVASSTCGEF